MKSLIITILLATFFLTAYTAAVVDFFWDYDTLGADW